jgi:hypothetical protein
VMNDADKLILSCGPVLVSNKICRTYLMPCSIFHKSIDSRNEVTLVTDNTWTGSGPNKVTDKRSSRVTRGWSFSVNQPLEMKATCILSALYA